MNRKQAMDSILDFWQQIVTDEEMPVQNRMKASELLYRSLQQKEEEPQPVEQDSDLSERIKEVRRILEKYQKGAENG